MTLLEKIKDEYAKENYDNGENHATCWKELVENDLSFDNEDIDEIAKRYAKAVLERAAENARMETVFTKNGERTTINKQSIINTDLE